MTMAAFDYTKLDVPEILQVTFHPRPDDQAPPTSDNVIDYRIPVADGIELGARFHMTEDTSSANILFFHGNGEIVGDYDDIGPMYNEQDMSLLAVDYRGYGSSGGSPTITAMMADAIIALKEIKKWLSANNRTGRLIVMGRSLGSASALEVASRCSKDIDALIIESGFAETLPLLATMGVNVEKAGLAESDGFHHIEKIRQVEKPTMILHAQNDQIIPISHGTVLQMECGASSKEIQIIPGAGHNNIIDVTGRLYFEVIKQFINKIGMRKRPKKVGVR
ncbi:MAG: alpha/beta hydrolase [Desulfobulbaceae bacterium]|nr:alpha/beta hydrolase [Desulfobulbaceae bacterium]